MSTKRVLATNDHGGPIKLSPSDTIFPNHTGANFKVLKTLNVKLSEWPQLTLQALEKYEKQVIADPNLSGVSHELLEHPTHAMSYAFPPNESEFLAGFDVSQGGRAFTMYPRSANATTLKLERYIERDVLAGSTGKMRENHVQHIWIHPKGLERRIHLSPHKHFVFATGAKITKLQVGLIVTKACELGVIYPPGFAPTRRGSELVPNPKLSSQREAFEKKVMNRIIIT